MERGFSPLARVAGPQSWRFWARGGGKEELALGLLRGSCDSIGRPYPLLILGQGPLPGWEGNWDLLTLACDGSWRQMEELAREQNATVPELEVRLLGIEPPRGDWEGARELAQAVAAGGEPPQQGGEDRLWCLPLDIPGDPGGELAARVARLFPERGAGHPGLGFLGGAPGAYRYLLFQRALRGSDFSMLWQLDTPEAATT
jgi:type VI secretion system protein VasJ